MTALDRVYNRHERFFKKNANLTCFIIDKLETAVAIQHTVSQFKAVIHQGI